MDLAKIIAWIAQYIPLITGIVTVASTIAALTPSKSDDRIVQLILDVINKLGLNVAKATNRDA